MLTLRENHIITAYHENASTEQAVLQTVAVSQTEASFVPQSQCIPQKKQKLFFIVGGITAFLLIVGTIKSYSKEREAQYTCVETTSIFFCSPQIDGFDDNILERVTSGSEMMHYDTRTKCSHVRINEIKEEYMASSNPLDFELLSSIWGNEAAKNNIETFRCRMAILDFYRQFEMSGGENGWQIYAKDTKSLPNTISYPKLYDKDGKYANFFFIVKNNITGNRRLAGYSFEDETEKPVFRFVIDIPKSGAIKSINAHNGDLIVEFDNQKKVSFPFYHTAYDFIEELSVDSIVYSVINGNINLIPGRTYWVEGTIGMDYPIKGCINVNKRYSLLFSYVINGDLRIESDEFGQYKNGKMFFNSETEATLTDKIEGLWGEYSEKTFLPFELRVIGCGLSGIQNEPVTPAPTPAPIIPELIEIVSESDYDEEPEDDQVSEKVEIAPKFPGGQSALLSFLSKNLIYPNECEKNGIQGIVIVKFVVNKDGHISDVFVDKGVNPHLDAEAVRVIKSMPKWTPGMQGGKYVNVNYTLPVRFRLY